MVTYQILFNQAPFNPQVLEERFKPKNSGLEISATSGIVPSESQCVKIVYKTPAQDVFVVGVYSDRAVAVITGPHESEIKDYLLKKILQVRLQEIGEK